MFRVLAAIAIVALAALNAAAEPLCGADPLEGIYVVHGRELDKQYTGVAVLRRLNEGYFMQTSIAFIDEEDGGIETTLSLDMVGLKDGDKIHFAWRFKEKLVGLTAYTVDAKKGILSGKWIAFPGGGECRTETLRKIGPAPRLLPGMKPASPDAVSRQPCPCGCDCRCGVCACFWPGTGRTLPTDARPAGAGTAPSCACWHGPSGPPARDRERARP